MPVSAYYKGHGDEVMDNMTGPKKGKSVFYATANKKGVKPMFDGGVVDTDDQELSEEEQQRLRDLRSAAPPPPPPPTAPPPSGGPGPMPMMAQPSPPPPTLGLDQSSDGTVAAKHDGPPMYAQDLPESPETGGPMTADQPDETATPSSPPAPPPSSGPPPVPGGSITTLSGMGGTGQGARAVPTYNQGSAQQRANDYLQKYLIDPKTGLPKKPSTLQNVLGGVMQVAGAVSPRFKPLANVDLHPNLTREYGNYELLNKAADEERKSEQAKSAEALAQERIATQKEIRMGGAGHPDALMAKYQTLSYLFSPEEARKMIGAQMEKLGAPTGRAMDFKLLKDHYRNQGMDDTAAESWALDDVAKAFNTPRNELQSGQYVPDRSGSSPDTGFKLLIYNRREAAWMTLYNVQPPASRTGTTTESTTQRAVTHDGIITKEPFTASTSRRPSNLVQPMPGSNAATAASTIGKAPVIGAAPPRSDQTVKPVTMMIPDGQGGHIMRTFRPGDTIPPGAQTATGINSENTLSGPNKTRKEFAGTIVERKPEILQQVDDLQAKIGPVAGRWNQLWVNKAGMNDPAFASLDQDLDMYSSALVVVHFGNRGGQAYREALKKHFSEAQSPEDLKARIESADKWILGYAKMGSKQPNSATAGAAGGTPQVGGMFDGKKVVKVTKIK